MQNFGTLQQLLLWFGIAVVRKEERGYIPRRAWLYCRKSVVIFPEERGYIAERARLYGGRAWLYSRKSAVIFLL
jgi:hypothetical protein